MRYICKSCRYRFNSEKEQKGKKCPYCGGKNLVEEPLAQELLNDTEE
ncbi:MAG: DNA-directed RNA polymerase subunit P [Nanoarchaeota archaeon]